jgi:hypothetical protein
MCDNMRLHKIKINDVEIEKINDFQFNKIIDCIENKYFPGSFVAQIINYKIELNLFSIINKIEINDKIYYKK